MTKKIQAALAAFFVFATVLSVPASATNRVQMLHGMNPPSSWFNQYMRNVRLGQGAAWWNNMAGTSTSWPGTYANLTIYPVTGLFVAVGPTNSNTVGTLYQFSQEETSAYGGYPSGAGSDALPADATKVVLQGTTTANGSNIGPLNPPGTAGLSIDYLIECQVQIVDTTSQSVNIVSSSGTITGTTANRDRNDSIACQSKAGTAATTGSQLPPSTDSGWVSVGYVAVANGTATITSGMVTASTQFGGFIQAGQANSITTGMLPHGDYVDLSSAQSVAGVKTFSNAPVLSGGVTYPLGSATTASTNQGTIGVDSSGFLAFRAQNGNGHQWQNADGTSTYGQLNASGLVINHPIQGSSNGSANAYVPPVYNSSGASIGSTTHIVTGNTNLNSSGTATINLTGAAAFSGVGTYYVVGTQPANQQNSGIPVVNTFRVSGSQFTLWGPSSQSVDWIAIGS